MRGRKPDAGTHTIGKFNNRRISPTFYPSRKSKTDDSPRITTMNNLAFKCAEEVEKYLGHLHNVAMKVQIGAARTIWLKAHRAFQTARCETRRRRADRLTTQLQILAQSSKELCDLAEESKQFPEVCAAARRAIDNLTRALNV